MTELTNEDILKKIDFPHNSWRKGKDTTCSAKERILGYIDRLRKPEQLSVEEIKAMLSDLYWDAFVQHELQVKESTGKSVKEFLTPAANGQA